MRDDFTGNVKRSLATRVGNLCSNPDCRSLTSGPRDDTTKAVNLGVAAHITGAAIRGPRYNASLSAKQRCHSDNGIWLCQNCAKLIDNDDARFPEALLRAWKLIAEDRARHSLGKTASDTTAAGGPTPELKLYLKSEGIRYFYAPQELQRRVVLGITNAGTGSARYPSLRFPRSCGLAVDPGGIDGNGRFGLPESPTRGESIAFNGGADHVIHGKNTLEIAILTQRGERRGIEGLSQDECKSGMASTGQLPVRWLFKSVRFVCGISCEGSASSEDKIEVPEEWVTQHGWPRASR
jgi:hypothetical protein